MDTHPRILALWFPKLSLAIAARQRQLFANRPVILVQGAGDEAVVSGFSGEAGRMGVVAGMTGGMARRRCPGGVFLPDNAGTCLDELEHVASILRTRATIHVAIESRDTIMAGIPAGVDEEQWADHVAGIARAWSGHEVRAGVASNRRAAIEAARASRSRLAVVPPDGSTDVVGPYRAETLDVELPPCAPLNGLAARAALARTFSRLQQVLGAYGQSFRRVELTIDADGGRRTWVADAAHPLHSAGEGLVLLTARMPADALHGLRGMRVSLSRLGPDVRVQRAADSAKPARRAAPAQAA
jgi:hypothetical protein